MNGCTFCQRKIELLSRPFAASLTPEMSEVRGGATLRRDSSYGNDKRPGARACTQGMVSLTRPRV